MLIGQENFPCKAELSAVLILPAQAGRPDAIGDGERRDLGVISRWPRQGRGWLRRLIWRIVHDERGLVTNAGVNYLATDFTSGLASPRVGAFTFHDSGTGTTAAAVTDTALQTPAGPARVSGAQSNPSSNQYQSVATISYTATLAITEWGLFSASTSGTLWDHRVFSAINVVSGNSISFTYAVTFPSGGT